MTATPYKEDGPAHLLLWEDRLTCAIHPAYIYVIQGEPFTAIKVGFAHGVMDRLAGLQTGNPTPLRLLHVVVGDRALERFLHRRLVKSRLQGEWFAYGDEVDVFLKWFSRLAERQVDTWSGRYDELPTYRDLDPAFDGMRQERPVTVRFVEPNPQMPKEQAEAIREAMRIGVSPSVLSPHDGGLNTWTSAPTPGRARHGGHRGSH